eukprot:7926365-Pyramimonas_sp.AAC.1
MSTEERRAKSARRGPWAATWLTVYRRFPSRARGRFHTRASLTARGREERKRREGEKGRGDRGRGEKETREGRKEREVRREEREKEEQRGE